MNDSSGLNVTAATTEDSSSSLEAYYAGEDNWSKVVFEFVLHGVFLNLIGVVGLVGNGLCIAVLTRPQMRNSTNLILTALATFDSVVIATSMLMLRYVYYLRRQWLVRIIVVLHQWSEIGTLDLMVSLDCSWVNNWNLQHFALVNNFGGLKAHIFNTRSRWLEAFPSCLYKMCTAKMGDNCLFSLLFLYYICICCIYCIH